MTPSLPPNALLEDLMGLNIPVCVMCGKAHTVLTREVSMEPGSAINRLPDMLAAYFSDGDILVAVDGNTWEAAGREIVRNIEKNRGRVHVHRVDTHHTPPHADDDTVAGLVQAVQAASPAGILAIGSGTINDLGKAASQITGIPLITVATAASMNGYTSAISALMNHGVKTTQPSTPPVAIIADPDILAKAPRKMNAAGFGDLLSKNASGADWKLGNILFGDYYCRFPVAVVEDAINRCIDNADAIRNNQPAGLRVLIEALMRSGISMVLAGSSSPASGGEHLISHLWDMTAHWTNRTPALHGEQTGITTLISLSLYERLLALTPEDIAQIDAVPAFESEQDMESGLGSVFRELAGAVMPFAKQKYLHADALAERRKLIIDHWDAVREALAGIVISPELSRSHLTHAGAPTTAAQLGIPADEVRFSYRYARWIRSRYTVLDLAAEIGVLDDWMEDILTRSGVI